MALKLLEDGIEDMMNAHLSCFAIGVS